MTNTIIVGLAAIIVGLAGLWLKWLVEKRRLTRQERAGLISEARDVINNFDFDRENFGDTVIYSRLRPYLRQETIEKVEPPNLTIYVGGSRGNQVVKHSLLDDVATLEKDLWNL